jgi:hypothetical protein
MGGSGSNSGTLDAVALIGIDVDMLCSEVDVLTSWLGIGFGVRRLIA